MAGSKPGKACAENLSAAELSKIGRKGGKIGGKARAAALTSAKRKKIARKAAAKTVGEEEMSLTDEDKDWIRRELREQLEHVETKLLTEFHKWASPNEARQRTHAAAIRALDLQIETTKIA